MDGMLIATNTNSFSITIITRHDIPRDSIRYWFKVTFTPPINHRVSVISNVFHNRTELLKAIDEYYDLVSNSGKKSWAI